MLVMVVVPGSCLTVIRPALLLTDTSLLVPARSLGPARPSGLWLRLLQALPLPPLSPALWSQRVLFGTGVSPALCVLIGREAIGQSKPTCSGINAA